MFPDDKEYAEIIGWLDRYELHLISGNCAVFAISMRRIFKEGELVAFEDSWGEGFGHVLLEREGKLYDGVGIWTMKEMVDEWGADGERSLVQNSSYIERNAPLFTCWFMEPETMIEEIRKAVKKAFGMTLKQKYGITVQKKPRLIKY